MVIVLTAMGKLSAKTYSFGGIIYNLDENSRTATVKSYDDTCPNVELHEGTITIEGLSYDIEWSYNNLQIFKGQNNLVSVDASALSFWLELSFENCSNLETVILPKKTNSNSLYERQFFNCPKLNLRSILDPKTSVPNWCFAFSEPTDCGTFDNIPLHRIAYENKNALENRLYSTIILEKDSLVSDNYISELKVLDVSLAKDVTLKRVILNEYLQNFTSIERLTVSNGGLYLGSRTPDKLQSVSLKDSTSILSISNLDKTVEINPINIESADNIIKIDFTDSEHINEFSIRNIPNIQSLNLLGKVHGHLCITDMSNLTTLTGCQGVKSVFFDDNPIIEKISFPDIEEIARESFYRNKSLKEVYFGEKLKEVDPDDLFYGCNELENLVYGGTLEQWLKIKFYVNAAKMNSATLTRVPNFWYGHGEEKHIKLTELNASNIGNIDTIGIGAFTGYMGLTKIDLPSSVKIIGDYAFANCKNVTDVNIRAERINAYSFFNCNSVSKYTFGNQLNHIGPAFNNDLTLRPTVNYLGEPYQWNDITRSNVANIDPYDPDSSIGYATNATPFLWFDNIYFNGELLTDLILDNPKKIDAFIRIKSLQTVTINCNDTFPEISNKAFYNCSNLKSVKFNQSANSRSITDRSNGFIIGEEAFSFCYALKDIQILERIKSIGKNALLSTSWMNERNGQIIYLDTELGHTAYTYSGSPAEGTALIIKEGTEAIADNAFCTRSNSLQDNFNGFTSLSLPSTLKYIGTYAFEGTKITGDITIPASVEFIGNSAFNCYQDIDNFTICDSPKPLVIGAIWLKNTTNIYYGRDFTPDVLNSNGGLNSNVKALKTTYGKFVTNVSGNNAAGNSAVEEVHSYSLIPPYCEKRENNIWGAYYPAFEDIDFEKCTLCVPESSIEAYRTADGWNLFTNIKAETSDVNSIPMDNDITKTHHYDLNGRAIDPKTKGIHIVVGNNGKSKKILVK